MNSQPARRSIRTPKGKLSILCRATLFALILACAACGGGGSTSSGGGGGTGGGGTGGGGTGGGGGSSTPSRAFNGDFALRLPSQNNFGASTSVVYDSPLKEIFVSDTYANSVEVYSAVDSHHVGSINIPGALGLSLTPDYSKLYVGTITSYIYSADPSALTITQRIPVPAKYLVTDQSGNTTVPAQVYAMADGSIFVAIGANPYTGSDGLGYNDQLLQYNPSNGTFKVNEPNSEGGLLPIRSADGTALLVPGGDDLSVYTTSSGSFAANTTLASNVGYSLAANTDGSQFAVALAEPNAPSVIVFYDKNLQQQSQLTLPNVTTGSVIFSRDGSKLFVIQPPGIFAAIDPASAAFSGYLGIDVAGSQFPSFVDVDENNHLFGVAGATLVAFNASQLQSTPPSMVPDFGDGVTAVNQLEGPISGGTPVTFVATPTGEGNDNGIESTEQAYFGSAMAASNAVAPYEGSTQNALTSNSPSTTSPGPVSLVVTDANGDAAFLPDAFTFGPHILSVFPNAVGTQGGDQIVITAYGLGFSGDSIKVTIGGAPVASKLNSYAGFIYPEQTLTFSAPAGKAGWADIVVTTPDGASATLSRGVQYLQQETNLSGAQYSNAVYDAKRNRFYLTGADANVAVFDVATNAFLDPLTSPKISASATLSGVAVNADDATLAVVDVTDRKLIIFDLNANTSTSISTVLATDTKYNLPWFVQMAANNTAVVEMQICATSQIREVNLSSGSVKGRPEGDTNCSYVGFPQFGEASADGSVVLFSGTPPVSPIPPAGIWEFKSSGDSITGPSYVGNTAWLGATPAVNADGSVLVTGSGVLDQRLLPLVPLKQFSLGGDSHFNSSGSLLVTADNLPLAGNGGIVFRDIHRGNVILSMPIPPTTYLGSSSLGVYPWRPLAISADASQMLFANINGGVSYFQLSVVPLAVGAVTPATGSAGAQITVHGSGFVSGTTVKIGGQSASCTPTDAQTISCAVPNVGAGPVGVSLTNPDGQTYSFDYAFVVQ